MSAFQILAVILTIAAVGGYVNYKYIKLPTTIGHMAFALLVSFGAIILSEIHLIDIGFLSRTIDRIDFSSIVLHGMLSVLLFAGALHINLHDLKSVRLTVLVLATIGVVLATFITGTLVWWGAAQIGVNLPYIYALLFGALIAPTDPIAVLSILKQLNVSKSLYVKTGGESLFNDGVGVVVFLALLEVINSPQEFEPLDVLGLFGWEAVGGAVLGLALGGIVYAAIRTINDYKLEALLTLALVVGGYALAELVHMSAPISMVVAGLFIGNHGRNFGMSDESRAHLDVFWELLDEIFNAILFILIGLRIMVTPISVEIMILGAGAICAVLVGRLLSVGIPISIMRIWKKFDRGTIRTLTWGGLRGGISIALALSLPDGDAKAVILPMTYIVVLFSILVQGLTFQHVLARVYKPSE
ncbi:MAG: sodium:proton antiporter [Pseudobdellovibrionaceae bacterium]